MGVVCRVRWGRPILQVLWMLCKFRKRLLVRLFGGHSKNYINSPISIPQSLLPNLRLYPAMLDGDKCKIADQHKSSKEQWNPDGVSVAQRMG